MKALGREKAFVVGALFGDYLSLGICLVMLGSIMPMMKAAYGLDYKTGGLLLSVMSVSSMIVAFGAGFLPKYIGMKRSIVLLYAGTPLGFAFMLLSGNPLWLMFSMVLIGTTRGAQTDYNNQIVSVYTEGNGTVLNVLHGFFAIGAFLAPFLVLLCTRSGGEGWRTAVMIASIIGFLLLLPNFGMKVEDRYFVQESGGGASLGFLHEKLFWITVILTTFYQGVENSIMGWLTTFFIDTGALSAGTAQMVTSLLWLSLLAGRFVCGYIASRFAPHRMLTVMSLGVAAFLALLVMSDTLPAMLVATVGLGLCLSGMYGTAVSNAGDVFERYPICMGVFVTITCIGTAVTPALVGYFADRTDIRMGMLVPLVCALFLVASAVYNSLYSRKHV